MKTCPNSKRLSAYVDGEMNQADVSSIDRHLAECSGCQQAVHQLAAVYDLLGQDRQMIRDPYLAARVRARLQEPAWYTKAGVRVAGWFAPATVMMGLILGFFLGSHLSTSIMDRQSQQEETLTDSSLWAESSSLASQFDDILIDGSIQNGESHD
jgi:predicted anti-sigma-YlaC factor YlaD